MEVHTPGDPGAATVKWSRDNGAVVARLGVDRPGGDGYMVTITPHGHDGVGSFAGAKWIELTDDRRILAGEAGFLLAVHGVTGRVITLTNVPPAMSEFGAGATVRRWDGVGSIVAGGWRPLAADDAATPRTASRSSSATGTTARATTGPCRPGR